MIVDRDPWTPITAKQWAELREAWPNGERLTVAWRLARDVDALADLLAGRPVAPGRINQRELAKARRASLVQLVAPIDLLEAA